MHTKLKALLLLTALAMAACTSTPAEVATFNAVAPEYAAYVQADPNLQPAQKQARLDLIESWRLRVGVAK